MICNFHDLPDDERPRVLAITDFIDAEGEERLVSWLMMKGGWWWWWWWWYHVCVVDLFTYFVGCVCAVLFVGIVKLSFTSFWGLFCWYKVKVMLAVIQGFDYGERVKV